MALNFCRKDCPKSCGCNEPIDERFRLESATKINFDVGGVMTNQEILTNFVRKRVLYGTDFDDHATELVYECQVCREVVDLFTEADAIEHYTNVHIKPKSNPQAILTKAIQKAIEGGWKPSMAPVATVHNGKREWTPTVVEYYAEWVEPLLYIFSHNFAKGLWGEHIPADPTPPVSISPGGKRGLVVTIKSPPPKNHGWQYHLQNMVISDDPIQYLADHLPE